LGGELLLSAQFSLNLPQRDTTLIRAMGPSVF
jgi:hypothetical protein